MLYTFTDTGILCYTKGMKVVVIGSGGREHAIAWKLAQSQSVSQVVCIPGNGGTALENKCVNIAPGSESAVDIAKREGCQLAVIGPEDPLAEGLADAFWQAGIPTVGPKREGAQLEASKDTAKQFMKKYGVACAKSRTFTDAYEAIDYVQKEGAPIVIKADGLAAGKGVVVAKTEEEAEEAILDLMENERVGKAGKKVVIEEYLRGVEVSVLAAVSVEPGKEKTACIVPFKCARDHKRLGEHATGPNTGGMGAICPVEDFTKDIEDQFTKNILEPTLKGFIAEKYDYRGFIFFGLMLTKDGPKCLEYNVRLGDPETQAVLPLMDSDFANVCRAITDGTLKDMNIQWKNAFAVAPVAVSGGYPREYKKGYPLIVREDDLKATGAKVFVAGAIVDRRATHPTGNLATLVTSGGRVLACSASALTFQEAWDKAYKAMSCIRFQSMYYRKDIGLPGASEST